MNIRLFIHFSVVAKDTQTNQSHVVNKQANQRQQKLNL